MTYFGCVFFLAKSSSHRWSITSASFTVTALPLVGVDCMYNLTGVVIPQLVADKQTLWPPEQVALSPSGP